jgi:hypothetical protein
MANTAMAQVCGTNGTVNNLEGLVLTGGQQQQLLCFRETTPQTTRVIGTVSGLQANELLLAIDYRSVDNSLIALSNQSNIYTLNQTTGAATLLATLRQNNQTVALQGNSFGFDENPTSKAIRIVSNTAQNLRLPNPATPADVVTDTALAVAGAPAGTAAPQGGTSAAYTNVDNAATTGTLLYVLDAVNNTLVTSTPANAGQLTNIGALGLDIDPNASFDIFTQVATGNTPQRNRALAVSQTANQPAVLFQVNLETGLASQNRNFANGVSVVGFALPIVQGNVNRPTTPTLPN